MAINKNINSNVLARGVNGAIWVNMNSDSANPDQLIGFVDSYEVSVTVTIDRAEVLGEFDPVSLDPTSRAVQITLSGFLPSKSILKDITSTRGGGDLSLIQFNPDSDTVALNGIFSKIPLFQIKDKKTQAVIGSTKWATASALRISSQGKGYIKLNSTFEGIGWNNGPDYVSVL